MKKKEKINEALFLVFHLRIESSEKVKQIEIRSQYKQKEFPNYLQIISQFQLALQKAKGTINLCCMGSKLRKKTKIRYIYIHIYDIYLAEHTYIFCRSAQHIYK